MRLTDKPRSLADVRPDVSWPAGLQATLDKALVRDVDERYKSAAQFGREFSAAIADMPMTQAVEAGTMVMNAAAAGKETVPPTRMNAARPSEKTTPMHVPVSPKKPAGAGVAPAPAASKVPMIAGVGGGLALVVAVGLYLSGPPSGLTPPGDGLTGGNSAQIGQKAAPGTLPSPTGGADTTAGGAESLSKSLPNATPGSTTPGTKTAPVNPASTSKAPTANPPQTSGPTNPTTSGAPAGALETIVKWRTQLENPGTEDEKVIARNLLREVEPMLPSLSGMLLADAQYVVLFGYYTIENDPGICRYGKLVQASSLAQERKSAATSMMAGARCGP